MICYCCCCSCCCLIIILGFLHLIVYLLDISFDISIILVIEKVEFLLYFLSRNHKYNLYLIITFFSPLSPFHNVVSNSHFHFFIHSFLGLPLLRLQLVYIHSVFDVDVIVANEVVILVLWLVVVVVVIVVTVMMMTLWW